MTRASLCGFILLTIGTGVLAQGPETMVVRPKVIDDVLVNPGIGFMTFQRFNGDQLNPGTGWTEGYPIEYQPFNGRLENPHHPMTSISYFRIYWKFIEPADGQYHWDLIDTALKTANDRGQTLMLRIAPYGTTADNDVPDWYRAKVGDESRKSLIIKWRTDPENPLYVQCFTRLVRELGKRYDGNPDLESVDLSIVGAWGEGEGTARLSEPVMGALMDSYLQSFQKTPLVVQPTDRRTVQYALVRKNVGWRVDCLGDMRCVDGRSWCHMFDYYPETLVNVGVQDAWQKAPVTLEACWVMQHWKDQGWDVNYIIDQSLKWHISSFNNKSSAVPDDWWPQVNRWLKKMGYRLALRRFAYPASVPPQGKLAFTTWWENQGVAPCYRQFPLAIRLANTQKTEVLITDADIRTWLPGDTVYNGAVSIPAEMPRGEYELSIALLDPVSHRPKVKLAIAGVQPDGWYSIGKVKVGE